MVEFAQGPGGAGPRWDFVNSRKSQEPLVLQDRGSFFVGGEVVEQTSIELGDLPPDDAITINQMYVEYMVPQDASGLPIILVHGATLSGKTYDTTPDGRMGWFEYFTRLRHPVFVVDQVGRGRSGFDQSVFNRVRAKLTPPEHQPAFLRLADRITNWQTFRFGPNPNKAFDDTKFPVEAAAELSKQCIPDLNRFLPSPNPTCKALSDLADMLGGAVVLGHSQSGRFPLEARLVNTKGTIKGIIMVEPGLAERESDETIAAFSTVPVLVVFGDHLDSDTGIPQLPFLWKDSHNDCLELIERINRAGGNARMLDPDGIGVTGNSHMLMQDVNNLEIADMLHAWIAGNALD